MNISIWLSIIINVLIVGIIVSGIIIGKRKGGAYELVKLGALLLVSGLTILLAPTVMMLIAKIGFVQTMLDNGLVSTALIKAISVVLLFLIGYILVGILLKVASKILENKAALKIQYAKPAKIVGLSPKETKRLRKEQKQLEKKQHKEQKKFAKESQSTKSKVLGIIFGLIIAILIGFVATLPVKPILNGIADAQPEISEITKSYEYTPYGQLDKVTGLVDTMLN